MERQDWDFSAAQLDVFLAILFRRHPKYQFVKESSTTRKQSGVRIWVHLQCGCLAASLPETT